MTRRLSRRPALAIAVAWASSLLVTAGWAGAQAQRWTPLAEPVVRFGNDVGFRVEWMADAVPMGALVVRLNGQWVEARIGAPPNTRVVPPPPPPPRAPGGPPSTPTPR
jgi:hypothetical protein